MAACQTSCNYCGGHQAGGRLAEAASPGEMQFAASVDLEAGSAPDSKGRDSKWRDVSMLRSQNDDLHEAAAQRLCEHLGQRLSGRHLSMSKQFINLMPRSLNY